MKLMRFRVFYFLISAVVLIPGILSLLFFGLKPAIDFTGGTLLAVQTSHDVTEQEWRDWAGDTFNIESVQKSEGNQYILRGKTITQEQKDEFLATVASHTDEVVVSRFETVGPILGQELIYKMLNAGLIVVVFILFFIAKQFSDLSFGFSAVLAMLHDTFVIVGSFSLLGILWGVEVDVLFVTALLTTLSFSVHDTIVVFDRIRELTRKYPKYSFEETADRAVSETLVRSLNNSVTILIMLLALVLLGGESIRWFALALFIGAVTGTYSSTFIAVPLLVVWNKRKK